MRAQEESKNVDNSVIGKLNIKVIGVGGAGCNIVYSLQKDSEISRIADFLIIDSDESHLSVFQNINERLFVEYPLDEDELSADSVEKIKNYLKERLKNFNCVFLVTSPGGRTGYTVGLQVAKIVRELKIPLLISILILPFESEKRRKDVHQKLTEFHRISDVTLTVDNDLLLKIAPHLLLNDAFGKINDIIAKLIKAFKNL